MVNPSKPSLTSNSIAFCFTSSTLFKSLTRILFNVRANINEYSFIYYDSQKNNIQVLRNVIPETINYSNQTRFLIVSKESNKTYAYEKSENSNH
ncbi:hypothetical protein [Pedobacter frigoris]|uniref:hypothetical protein n=1 Tax=Pedobacter frigoris TaxID=2571272 RepID=UPI003977C59A